MSKTKTSNCTPIVKWAGGKRQLLSVIKERMPVQFNTYYEPFFGGGAVFFEINPEKAVINDINIQLMNLYKQIRDDYASVLSIVDTYQDFFNSLDSDESRSKYYYDSRARFNELLLGKILNSESAALFLFLNKTGFNGMYRENAKGGFNIPFGQKKSVNAYTSNNIREVSSRLQNAKILCDDFENVCKDAKRGDFVFFDSPYYDTFDTYKAGGFSIEDHQRLSKLFRELSQKGVYCMLTNSNTDFIKDLYSDFSIEVLDVKRMINRNANERTGKEVIIKNY